MYWGFIWIHQISSFLSGKELKGKNDKLEREKEVERENIVSAKMRSVEMTNMPGDITW